MRDDTGGNGGATPHAERPGPRHHGRIAIAFAMGVALTAVGGNHFFPEVRASETCGTEGAKDYCASTVCGPCAEGEGDCDPGQCASGLECVEEGELDHCRSTGSCATDGAKDYCASTVCGPCAEGEGDCDPGQCASGLECVEEGDIDHCRSTGTCGTEGTKDYCASTACGPCAEGEGDCDPGQCATGLECVEEGDIDHCRATGSCGTPGAKDYCASTVCGPCAEGEGDCDPGQCATGLACVEAGAIDYCGTSETCGTSGAWNYCDPASCGPCDAGEGDCDPGECAEGLGCAEEGSVDHCAVLEAGYLEVWDDGGWQFICCDGGTPGVSGTPCWWSVYDRTLTDETSGYRLDCLEGDPQACVCNSVGETLHGADWSIFQWGGGPLYPNYLEESCVVVDGGGGLATDWTGGHCPDFRLE